MISRLERFNEWWFTGKVRRELAPRFKRYAFARMLSAASERQILIVAGLRRTGKTTLMYQVIESLLETEDPKRLLYFSFEDAESGPREVLEHYEKEVLKKPLEEAGRIYVFLDEIQYAGGWAAAVKQFYDLYPNLKFFVSGSSSLLL
ncbi:MAG: AAA family ATPase, partial [Candidatus Verstraetearchaeota archaeon]|nr:AAA family ATPase [Candidatus Verstraetearchaeota archaeon]